MMLLGTHRIIPSGQIQLSVNTCEQRNLDLDFFGSGKKTIIKEIPLPCASNTSDLAPCNREKQLSVPLHLLPRTSGHMKIIWEDSIQSKIL